MPEARPNVYLLNGEDDFSIDQTIAEQAGKVDANPTNAEINTTRLDGNSFNIDQLYTVAGALPFLAQRRLVILINPTARIANSEPAKEKFRTTLEKIPPSTDLLLVEYKLLTSNKDRKAKKIHWLEQWAVQHPNRAVLKTFTPPQGNELIDRIRQIAQTAGGSIETEAARHLGGLVDGNLRVARQEIEKLLAYVNYQRPITYDDVILHTADIGEGDVFAMVDALAARDGRRAMGILKRLQEYNEYSALYGMIVRQFRLLIQAREILDSGGRVGELPRLLKVHPFVADKLAAQAPRISMADLETAFHRLLQVDVAVKTGKAPDFLALEFFVSAFTAAPTQTLIPTG